MQRPQLWQWKPSPEYHCRHIKQARLPKSFPQAVHLRDTPCVALQLQHTTHFTLGRCSRLLQKRPSSCPCSQQTIAPQQGATRFTLRSWCRQAITDGRRLEPLPPENFFCCSFLLPDIAAVVGGTGTRIDFSLARVELMIGVFTLKNFCRPKQAMSSCKLESKSSSKRVELMLPRAMLRGVLSRFRQKVSSCLQLLSYS